MWDNQVKGCQFAAWNVVKAQRTVSADSPCWMWLFALTYVRSS